MGISRTLKNSCKAYKLLLDYCGGLIWSISTPFSLNDLMTLDPLGYITQRSSHMYMAHPRTVFSFVVALICNLRKAIVCQTDRGSLLQISILLFILSGLVSTSVSVLIPASIRLCQTWDFHPCCCNHNWILIYCKKISWVRLRTTLV